MSTPSPTPTHNDPAPAILHAFWTGLSSMAERHPWVPVMLGLMLLVAVIRSGRVAIHSGPRDEVRLFSRADKHALLDLAGHRCEHQGWIGGRCTSTAHLEADHVHPWSRGGWTNVRNGQILCRSHNRAKSAVIPWDHTLRRLAERRAAYYPAGASREVLRRAGATR